MKALIFGVSGQDGSYLARFLCNRGYEVFGTTRTVCEKRQAEFRKKLPKGLTLLNLNMSDLNATKDIIAKIRPDEIYNLAGQSSVGLSFELPAETIQSIVISTLNVLQSIYEVAPKTRFFNAGSCEIYGQANGVISEGKHMISPLSPYAVGKAAVYHAVRNYRESYGLFVCTGILGNHDSVLRPSHFVIKKLMAGAYDISRGKLEQIEVGDLSVIRDWGYAGEYVEAMWKMLGTNTPHDFIIASGESMSLAEYAKEIFNYFGLKIESHIQVSDSFTRPQEIASIELNPERINQDLGWKFSMTKKNLVAFMCEEYEKSKQNNN
jgi:GDPmannose 4,6-dehydratase